MKGVDSGDFFDERLAMGFDIYKQPHYLMQFFAYKHLPPHLQLISQPFASMAESISRELPRNPESEMALRKLLEAKDCAVRALIYKDDDAANR